SAGSATLTISAARVKTVLSNTNGTYPVSTYGQAIALSAQVTDIDHNTPITSGYIEIQAFCRLTEVNDPTGPCTTANLLYITPDSYDGNTSQLTQTLTLDNTGIATVSISTLPVGGPGFIKAIYHPTANNVGNYAIQPYDNQQIPEGTDDGAPKTPAT